LPIFSGLLHWGQKAFNLAAAKDNYHHQFPINLRRSTWAIPLLLRNAPLTFWTWNLAPIIGADADDPKHSHFAMDLTPERIFLQSRWSSKTRGRWLGADANIVKKPPIATDRIPGWNPKIHHIAFSPAIRAKQSG
jgi:hypothetical protein